MFSSLKTTDGSNTLKSLNVGTLNAEDINVDDIFYIDTTNNNVGIGTDAPTAKLEVNGNTNINGNTVNQTYNGFTTTSFCGVSER